MHRLLLLALLFSTACGAPARPRAAPVSAAPAPAPAPPEAAPTVVWTRTPGARLSGGAPVAVPNLATRLEVLEVTPDSFRVRCPSCAGRPEGWLARAAVAWAVGSPEGARQGELAEFIAALREAALRQEWDAMRRVMSTSFVHSISGPDGSLAAIGAWRGARAAELARLSAVLERGAVSVPGTQIWAAPPEFASVRGYQELRAGFTRGPQGWEWVFLVRAERP